MSFQLSLCAPIERQLDVAGDRNRQPSTSVILEMCPRTPAKLPVATSKVQHLITPTVQAS